MVRGTEGGGDGQRAGHAGDDGVRGGAQHKYIVTISPLSLALIRSIVTISPLSLALIRSIVTISPFSLALIRHRASFGHDKPIASRPYINPTDSRTSIPRLRSGINLLLFMIGFPSSHCCVSRRGLRRRWSARRSCTCARFTPVSNHASARRAWNE